MWCDCCVAQCGCVFVAFMRGCVGMRDMGMMECGVYVLIFVRAIRSKGKMGCGARVQ
jgi:hypothetical protein